MPLPSPKVLNIFFRPALVLVLTVLRGSTSLAQVRVALWSDVHSPLATIADHAAVIDQLGREYLRENPKGEFVIVVDGDFTSLSPYTRAEKGMKSFEVLRFLAQERKYTVIFVPGNHDAFDWTGEVDGVEVFKQQIKLLHSWGGYTLAANMKGVSKDVRSIIRPYYDLRGVREKTRLIGMTLRTLLQQSRLTRRSAARLFAEIEPYGPVLVRELDQAVQDGVRKVVLALHAGLGNVSNLVDETADEFSQRDLGLSLVMAGHDHEVVSELQGHAALIDAGANGSFTIADLDPRGEFIKGSPVHFAVGDEQEGLIREGRWRSQQGFPLRNYPPTLKRLKLGLTAWVERLDLELQRVLTVTRGFPEHKMHFKQGRTTLGSLLGEALVAWTRDQEWYKGQPIVAMLNSSAYRLEEPIPPGPLREITIRRMDPYQDIVTLFEVTGEQLENMFRNLRDYYSGHHQPYYTPQMNLGSRENGDGLEVQTAGGWKKISPTEKYLVPLDGFLSLHQDGESYELPEWMFLQFFEAKAEACYGDILVRYLPGLIESYERGQDLKEEQAPPKIEESTPRGFPRGLAAPLPARGGSTAHAARGGSTAHAAIRCSSLHGV
ncbi:MAG: hypothetical protein C5B49_08360 [Bdellovibrio sp.]|nr:MAG: hypothetical protein C5B49_08360 [Bdellovibrio sp.]